MRKTRASKKSLLNFRRFYNRQWLAISAILVLMAIIILSVSRASIPVYRDNWDYWGPRIKSCESGDYTEHHRGPGGATGAWQIQDATWGGFAGYVRAYQAPPSVQDAKALQLFLSRGTQPWDASYLCWRNGANPPPAAPPAPAPITAIAPPEGHSDLNGCSFTGWALQRTNPAANLQIEIDLDGKPAITQAANLPRDDVNHATGITGNHGFNWDVTGNWRDGAAHPYQVVAIGYNDPSVRTNLAQGQLNCQPANVGDGGGLQGQYFANTVLAGVPSLKRLDPTINFDWSGYSPGGSVPLNNFSVLWSGKLLAQYDEKYTISATADDGVRVYIGDVLVINHWRNQAATERTGTITLESGHFYNIRVEYYEAKSKASIKLEWSSYSTPKQVIPRSQLYTLPQ